MWWNLDWWKCFNYAPIILSNIGQESFIFMCWNLDWSKFKKLLLLSWSTHTMPTSTGGEYLFYWVQWFLLDYKEGNTLVMNTNNSEKTESGGHRLHLLWPAFQVIVYQWGAKNSGSCSCHFVSLALFLFLWPTISKTHITELEIPSPHRSIQIPSSATFQSIDVIPLGIEDLVLIQCSKRSLQFDLASINDPYILASKLMPGFLSYPRYAKTVIKTIQNHTCLKQNNESMHKFITIFL